MSNKKIIRLVLLLSIFAGAAISAVTPSYAVGAYYAGLVNMKVRSGPGIDFPAQGEMRGGDLFMMDNCRDNYCFITVVRDGLTGWIPRSQYSSTPTMLAGAYYNTAPDPHLVISTNKLNLRSGPGQDHFLLGQVPKDERLYRDSCQSGYCFVERTNGYRGWVLESALIQAPPLGGEFPVPVDNGTTAQAPAAETPIMVVPLGTVQVQDQSGAPPFLPVSEACFYEHSNYQGRSLCFNTGSEARNLANMNNWNDRISSIRISGGYSIQIFEHADFRGDSLNIEKSTPHLGSFNDRISSFVVYAMH